MHSGRTFPTGEIGRKDLSDGSLFWEFDRGDLHRFPVE